MTKGVYATSRASGIWKFWDRIVLGGTSGCWEWTGRTTAGGYGQIVDRGERMYAHRFAYELLSGRIPAGLTIDHLCRNRACVNPDHLEPVPAAENTHRGLVLHRTACRHGHPYGPDTKVYRGARRCASCTRKWNENRRKGAAS